MALYDRNYANQSSMNENLAGQGAYETQASTDMRAFVKQTYQLFVASLLAATAGAYVGIGLVSVVATWYWGFIILELGLMFGVYATKRKAGINLIMLFGFTFVSGLTLAPLLSHFLGTPAGAGIVANAFLLTTVAFGGLTLFAMNTSRDFSAMGKMLFIVLIVILYL